MHSDAWNPPLSSYSLRALDAVHAEAGTSLWPHSPQSRADFVQALEILSGERVTRFASRRIEAEPVLAAIDLPYATWLRVFGNPQSIEKHFDAYSRRSFTTWTHPCRDGFASCTGAIYQLTSGQRWVTVEFVRLRRPRPSNATAGTRSGS